MTAQTVLEHLLTLFCLINVFICPLSILLLDPPITPPPDAIRKVSS